MMGEVIEELKKIADYLYREDVDTAYAVLAGVIPKFSLAIGDVEDEGTRNLLVEKLGMALNAMENNDTLLLADTIQYELLDVLENF